MILLVTARCTSARSKTPASAAYCACSTICRSRSPSSSARSGRRAALQRVVDLVGLLEQEGAQRQVVLLAVPGTAVRLAQAVHEPGQAEGAGHVEVVGQRRQQDGAAASAAASARADRGVTRAAEDRVVRRDRDAAAGPRGRRRGHGARAGRRGRGAAPAGSARAGRRRPRRQEQQREPRIEGPAGQPVEGHHLQSIGRVDAGPGQQLEDGRVGQGVQGDGHGVGQPGRATSRGPGGRAPRGSR